MEAHIDMSHEIELKGLRGTLKLAEPMARYVSWRAGGPAARLYVPADVNDLVAFLRQMAAGEPLMFVGLGSNLLVRDGGFSGTVVLTHAAAKRPEMLLGRIYAEAGVACPKLARFAALHDLGGAEFLAGVPGSVGGALAMNAGCYGGETWDIVERAVTVNRSGDLRVRDRKEFEVGYRYCALRDGGEIGEGEWFVAAYFKLAAGHGEVSRRRIKELLAQRVAKQPLALPNAGSVFRNPIGDHAARLIEYCGLKGLVHGGALVSDKHANFIVNPKGAGSAADIEWLIQTVRATVLEKTGVALVPEVRIVGEPA